MIVLQKDYRDYNNLTSTNYIYVMSKEARAWKFSEQCIYACMASKAYAQEIAKPQMVAKMLRYADIHAEGLSARQSTR